MNGGTIQPMRNAEMVLHHSQEWQSIGDQGLGCYRNACTSQEFILKNVSQIAPEYQQLLFRALYHYPNTPKILLLPDQIGKLARFSTPPFRYYPPIRRQPQNKLSSINCANPGPYSRGWIHSTLPNTGVGGFYDRCQRLNIDHYQKSHEVEKGIQESFKGEIYYFVQRADTTLEEYLRSFEGEQKILEYLLLNVLESVWALKKRYGCFGLTRKMMRMRNGCHCLVWIHENFEECSPQYPLSRQDKQRKTADLLSDENSMLEDIYRAFRLSLKTLVNRLSTNQQGFQSAIRQLSSILGGSFSKKLLPLNLDKALKINFEFTPLSERPLLSARRYGEIDPPTQIPQQLTTSQKHLSQSALSSFRLQKLKINSKEAILKRYPKRMMGAASNREDEGIGELRAHSNGTGIVTGKGKLDFNSSEGKILAMGSQTSEQTLGSQSPKEARKYASPINQHQDCFNSQVKETIDPEKVNYSQKHKHPGHAQNKTSSTINNLQQIETSSLGSYQTRLRPESAQDKIELQFDLKKRWAPKTDSGKRMRKNAPVLGEKSETKITAKRQLNQTQTYTPKCSSFATPFKPSLREKHEYNVLSEVQAFSHLQPPVEQQPQIPIRVNTLPESPRIHSPSPSIFLSDTFLKPPATLFLAQAISILEDEDPNPKIILEDYQNTLTDEFQKLFVSQEIKESRPLSSQILQEFSSVI